LDDGDLDLIDSTPEDKEEAAKAVQSSRSGYLFESPSKIFP
jgi:hypothetical protein